MVFNFYSRSSLKTSRLESHGMSGSTTTLCDPLELKASSDKTNFESHFPKTGPKIIYKERQKQKGFWSSTVSEIEFDEHANST